MRIRAASLVALLLAQPLAAQPAPDPRGVVAAVLAEEVRARGNENAAETCVATGFAGATPAPDGDDAMAPVGAVRIRPQWHGLPTAARDRPVYTPPPEDGRRRRRHRERREPVPLPAPLAQAEAARLDTLWRQATASPAPAARGFEAALVPAPLRAQRPDDDCALIVLSAPAFADAADTAFVEVAYMCGSVCGNGGLYALERRDGRWAVVGIADTWIR
jgi:hypothetical protein